MERKHSKSTFNCLSHCTLSVCICNFCLRNSKLYWFVPLYFLKVCLYFTYTDLHSILLLKTRWKCVFCLCTVFSDLWSDEKINLKSPPNYNYESGFIQCSDYYSGIVCKSVYIWLITASFSNLNITLQNKMFANLNVISSDICMSLWIQHLLND